MSKDLKTWLRENDCSAANFAKLIGAKEPKSVYDYMDGTIPRKARMKKIIEVTKGEVTPASFYNASH